MTSIQEYAARVSLENKIEAIRANFKSLVEIISDQLQAFDQLIRVPAEEVLNDITIYKKQVLHDVVENVNRKTLYALLKTETLHPKLLHYAFPLMKQLNWPQFEVEAFLASIQQGFEAEGDLRDIFERPPLQELCGILEDAKLLFNSEIFLIDGVIAAI